MSPSRKSCGCARFCTEASTATGMSGSVPARILGLSERTVNFHVANAMAKLGAAHKTAGVVKTALLGLL